MARGWHSRAASFLAREQETREHGILEWLASRFAVAEGKLEEALQHAERALALGRRLADPDLEALGLTFGGLALLTLGDVSSGIARQDEAAAAVARGRSQPLGRRHGLLWDPVGLPQPARLGAGGPVDREFTRWCERGHLLGFPGLCRLHRAEVLGVCGEIARQSRRSARLANVCP